MVARELSIAEWRAMRESLGVPTLGSSNAAAAIGESRYTSPQELYAQKLGIIERPDFSDSRAVRRGNRLESWAIEEYAMETGRRVLDSVRDRETIERELTSDGACEVLGWVAIDDARFQAFLRSTRYPWMVATLDSLSIDPNEGLVIVEAKSLGWRQIIDWGNDSEEAAPVEYRAQVLHDLIVAPSARHAALAAIIGAADFRLVHERAVSPSMSLDDIVALERYFVECVRDGVEPITATIAGESLRRARMALHPDDSGTSMILPSEAVSLHYALVAAKADRSAAQARCEELKDRIESLIAPHTFGELPDGSGAYAWRTKSRAAHNVAGSSWKQLDFIAPKNTKRKR